MSTESSVDMGSLSPLRHDFDYGDKNDTEVTEVTDPIELHADQEELEFESYADSAMTIPGQGKPGENCETWQPFEFCDVCGEPQMGMSRCERRTCPNCYKMWDKERTIGGVQRLAKARYAEDDGIDRRMVHAVMSPPTADEWERERITSIQEWYDGYSKAYSLAVEQGIRGGVVIGHGYRVQDSVKQKYRALDVDYGIWRWIRQDLPKSWRSYTYWSPHYHVIGLCRDLAENKPAQQNGWAAVRLRALDKFTGLTDKNGVDDMVSAMRYPLSHGTFESGTSKDCVRWFGDLATTKFRPDEELSDGANDTINRVVDEVVGNPIEDDEGGGFGADQDEQECANDGCDSTSFSPIFDAGAALQDRGWCKEIGREQQRRLQTAFDWMIGDIEPPPGLKNPRTEAEAQETLEEML